MTAGESGDSLLPWTDTISVTGSSSGSGGKSQFVAIGPVSVTSAFGMNIFACLFMLLGSNLRHTHLWIDYGPRLSRILISPAQHQIHHSADPRHFDKNIGFIFAFWDDLFGTL